MLFGFTGSGPTSRDYQEIRTLSLGFIILRDLALLLGISKRFGLCPWGFRLKQMDTLLWTIGLRLLHWVTSFDFGPIELLTLDTLNHWTSDSSNHWTLDPLNLILVIELIEFDLYIGYQTRKILTSVFIELIVNFDFRIKMLWIGRRPLFCNFVLNSV